MLDGGILGRIEYIYSNRLSMGKIRKEENALWSFAPHDISVVGFGNVLLSEYFSVPLTTVRQPKFRLGVAAMETMQQLLLGRRPESKRLPAELLIRASSGSAPATAHLKV